jgi:hypothetical protein
MYKYYKKKDDSKDFTVLYILLARLKVRLSAVASGPQPPAFPPISEVGGATVGCQLLFHASADF